LVNFGGFFKNNWKDEGNLFNHQKQKTGSTTDYDRENTMLLILPLIVE